MWIHAAFGFTFTTAKLLTRQNKPQYRSSLSLLKTKISGVNFIHNQQEEDPVFGTCGTPTQTRPVMAPEYLLYMRYFRFILPAAFAVTVKQGNS